LLSPYKATSNELYCTALFIALCGELAGQAARHRLRVAWSKPLHSLLRDVSMALAPLALPIYVVLWIVDWLPLLARESVGAMFAVRDAHVVGKPEYKKTRLIESVFTSRKKLK
jgi:hypothetical protein